MDRWFIISPSVFLPKASKWPTFEVSDTWVLISVGPQLLGGDLMYGPVLCKWLARVFYWVHEDSEIGARTRDDGIYF